MVTNNQERLILKTDGKLGLGISNPRAWQEIFYCHTQGNQDAGLVVTSFDGCNANNGLPPNPVDDGRILPPGSGINPGEGDPIFNLPANFFLTGHSSTALIPLSSVSMRPMLWLRSESALNAGGIGTPGFNTRFIVTESGQTGINVLNPRAALDVRGNHSANVPVAIFGSQALGTNTVSPLGLTQYFTKQVSVFTNLAENECKLVCNAKSFEEELFIYVDLDLLEAKSFLNNCFNLLTTKFTYNFIQDIMQPPELI